MDKRMAVSILTILYTLIFLPGILLFISVRKNYYINGKPAKLIVLQSLGAFVLGIYQFYDYGSRYSICAAQLWVFHFAALFYFTPVIFSCVRAFYLSRMGTEVLRGYAQEETKLFSSFIGKIIYHSLNSVYFGKTIKYPEVKKLEFPFWMSVNLRKYQIITRMDDLFFIFTMILTAAMLCVAGIIQGVGVSHRAYPILDINNCVAGQDIYFVYSVIIFIVLVLTPIAIIAVRNVRENYGLVSEAINIGALNIWFIGMYVVWIAVIYPQYPKIYERFPAQGWIIIMTLFTFTISVLLPIKKSYSRSNILLYNRENFNKMLTTQPEDWDKFEEAVIADFKFPLLIFELHIQELLEQIYNTSVQNNVLSDNFVKGQNYIKYCEIIRIYFCLDSPFCLPLTNSWLDEIQQKLVSTKITVGIFDETRNYVNDSLFVNTYCRVQQFRTAQEESIRSMFWPSNPQFLLYRYFSRGSKESKGSKVSSAQKESKLPSVPTLDPIKTASEDVESPADNFKFNARTISSIYSPYLEQQSELPSAVTTHRISSLDDENNQQSAVSKRHSVYPMQERKNGSLVQTDSLMIEGANQSSSQSSPIDAHEEDEDDADFQPLSEVRDSMEIHQRTVKDEESVQPTHMMDRKSFTAINIENDESHQVNSLIKKYQTDSYASETRDSLGGQHSIYSNVSGSVDPERSITSYYRESYITSIAESDQISSIVTPTDMQPAFNPESTDAPHSRRISESKLSSGTRPYFVIEEEGN